MAPIKIALADDHKIVRDGLRSMLKEIKSVKAKVVVDAGNGRELLEAMEKERVDVLILDIQMPELDGEEALCVITKKYPAVKVIILSLHNEWKVAEKFIRLGAHAFLCKNYGKEELESAIISVMNNKTYFSSLVIEDKKIQLMGNPDNIILDPEEKLILKSLVRGQTAKQMSEDFGISEKTIEFYKNRLFKKTRTKNANSLVAYTVKNQIIDY